ncbi:MAG: potassium channel protein [Nitrospinaceae bacterium]|jgi:voltage-gated potassium channel|nr:potassium channel protein [Nitrospinaceae bacterium]MBT3433483.1 potassium channel protein [Nitrospinaceae bacterium]MBT3821583.1 potassium channel protein [Nitrospinaceae bacterium]MBT4094035.1 potassium channel protein [Nitrospinaceae bacterium]MBT4429506.1 potassium channel protein [Nitrospinaceae bacterium]
MKSLWKRLLFAFVVLVLVLLAGVIGYMSIEGWTFFDALYMTVISLTTVGYGEVRDLTTNGRIFTILLLFSGMGILAYGMGTFTAFLVEGQLLDYLRGRQMQKKIQRLRNHFIICGYRGEGRYALEELIKTKTPHVVVDKDLSELKAMFPDEDILTVEGDPTREQTLALANIENAQGLISALSVDSENLLVVLSAREMSTTVRIISCVYERESAQKFQRVGANGTVMADFIGGLRMASEAIRPTVVSFLDTMLRGQDKTLRIEEVRVIEKAVDWVGKTLREIDFPKQTGLLVVAVKSLGSESYIYNPGAEYVVEKDNVFIVIGQIDQVIKMKKLLGHDIQEEDLEESSVSTGSSANSG